MNSAQRRKTKRAHPYEVTLRADSDDSWSVHDDLVFDAQRWCHKKAKGWVTDAHWDYTVFKFTREQDAVLFALRFA